MSGCASPPLATQVAATDHGAFPDQHEAIVKGYYQRALQDRGQAFYGEISEPRKYSVDSTSEGATHGYLVCVALAARNTNGNYDGYKTYGLLIRNGAVVHAARYGVFYAKEIC
ncbi:hypothetical protein [Pelomonas sp. SE-A7]|uniref:hypothetical protein n=1 Tax=Pelomonas sp. SE-A7 TaxID=3054953 RepID=UPI00259CCD8D|nr:hypothetical protein [Pelomonas sp. SE-A7]MDM4766879.1 hypothetical protein [Pelomonas sp. SE-A7]